MNLLCSMSLGLCSRQSAIALSGSFAVATVRLLSSRGKDSWNFPCLSVNSLTFASRISRTSTPRSTAALRRSAAGA